MIVIADASPLVALTICESLDILDKLFENVKKKGILKSIKPHVKILRSSQIYFNPNLLDYALKIANEYE